MIIQGDCIEVLRDIRGAVLIFADSIYNIGIDYGPEINDRKTDFEYRYWCEQWLQRCYNSLLSYGSLWVLNTHENIGLLYQSFKDIGFHIRQHIVIYETFGTNCFYKFNRCSRILLHLVKDKDEFIFNSHAPEVRRKSDRQEIYNDIRANPDGKLLDDVWQVNRICGTHSERIPEVPTQISETIVRRVIAVASNPGDLVIDPFLGSGTTGIIAKALKRNFIGIELIPKYAEIARKRIGEE